jgi:large subunit ribosomal protein L3
MGNKRATQPGLEIVSIDAKENVLLVRGSVPGPRGGVVEVRSNA